jgi:hypothetical protein
MSRAVMREESPNFTANKVGGYTVWTTEEETQICLDGEQIYNDMVEAAARNRRRPYFDT